MKYEPTHVTNTGGMPPWVTHAIDVLLPILPGDDPSFYVTADGRPDGGLIAQGYQPHSDSSEYAARLIRDLWAARTSNALVGLIGRADAGNRARVATALRIIADGIDPLDVFREGGDA